jgi:hypothetical protein
MAGGLSSAALSETGAQFDTFGVRSQLTDLAALQLVLHLLPIVNAQQIAILLVEAAARKIVLQLQSILELVGQKDHSVFEKPTRQNFLAGLTI